jgi:2-polyprenyl-3-methyl-5-hydroxy-6-metoxy-1,4-benzoquinol methylase
VSYATLDLLRSDLGRAAQSSVRSPAYIAKMLHDVPESTVVDREAFILERVAGKRVLDIGASGALHDKVRAASQATIGIDRQAREGVLAVDLDEIINYYDGLGPDIPVIAEFPQLILCGEVLEHLANPGWLLQRLHTQYPSVPLLVTAPNAFAKAGTRHIQQGIENVNRDHVAWYSYTTLKTLLVRYDYTVREFFWYKGVPYVAEGLIMVTG